jgi:O-acetyl-ADP-ribose deacetylase (regulator of RNase III)
MSIQYVIGDATHPIGTGIRIIAHVVNHLGGWGKGFVLSLSQRWPEPEAKYRDWHRTGKAKCGSFLFGNVQFVSVQHHLNSNGLIVANMLAQYGYYNQYKPYIIPLRYDALKACLSKVSIFARVNQASVHMGRIGCGLGGGKWELVEPIIQSELIEQQVPVIIYDLPQ